jgi:hypothetical protein
VVDVVDEAVERADALHQPALDVVPLGRGQDPRHEVERERAVANHAAAGPIGARAVVAGRVEGDALLDEDRVAAVAGGGQQLGAEAGDLGGERDRVVARPAVGPEDLVEAAGLRAVGRGGVGDQVGQGADPLPKRGRRVWIYVEIGRAAGVRTVEYAHG